LYLHMLQKYSMTSNSAHSTDGCVRILLGGD
jgi:hypothetical protein